MFLLFRDLRRFAHGVDRDYALERVPGSLVKKREFQFRRHQKFKLVLLGLIEFRQVGWKDGLVWV